MPSGLRTAFVARPLENGPAKEAAALASFPADVSAGFFGVGGEVGVEVAQELQETARRTRHGG